MAAKETTKVKKCTCKNEGQDKIYGDGNRLFNQTSKTAGQDKAIYKCTVCGSTSNFSI